MPSHNRRPITVPEYFVVWSLSDVYRFDHNFLSRSCRNILAWTFVRKEMYQIPAGWRSVGSMMMMPDESWCFSLQTSFSTALWRYWDHLGFQIISSGLVKSISFSPGIHNSTIPLVLILSLSLSGVISVISWCPSSSLVGLVKMDKPESRTKASLTSVTQWEKVLSSIPMVVWSVMIWWPV